MSSHNQFSECWPAERCDRLKGLFDQGNSASQIAEIMGLSRNAVIGKLHRLGLRRGYDNKANHRVAKPKAPRKPAPKAMRPLVIPAAVRAPVWSPPVQIDLPRPNEALPESRRVSIMELRNGVCHWPLGDPGAPDFAYCGADCDPARVYCEAHRLLSIGTGTPGERAAHKVGRSA